jgi:hypothetical protein
MLSMSGKGTGSSVWGAGYNVLGACGFGVLRTEGGTGHRLVLSNTSCSGEALLSLATYPGMKSFLGQTSCFC